MFLKTLIFVFVVVQISQMRFVFVSLLYLDCIERKHDGPVKYILFLGTKTNELGVELNFED